MSLMETHIEVLKTEVQILRSRLRTEDTGHIHTAISVLEARINEIHKNISEEYSFMEILPR